MSGTLAYHEMAWQLIEEVNAHVGLCPVNSTVEGTDMAIFPIHITWQASCEYDGRAAAKALQDILLSDRWQGNGVPDDEWEIGRVFRDNTLDGRIYRFRICAGPFAAVVTCPKDEQEEA